jgi:hypothetical protein
MFAGDTKNNKLHNEADTEKPEKIYQNSMTVAANAYGKIMIVPVIVLNPIMVGVLLKLENEQEPAKKMSLVTTGLRVNKLGKLVVILPNRFVACLPTRCVILYQVLKDNSETLVNLSVT